MEEQLILVNEHNERIGVAPKMRVHEEALLHRAFSVFVWRRSSNGQGWEVLLQQRAHHKYHCGGLWTNTCCSHPRPGESVVAAGERRLKEELGLQVPLREVGVFTYRAEFHNGLTEHEIDHVLVGWCEEGEVPLPNPEEVAAIRWVGLTTLKEELAKTQELFTPWLGEALSLVENQF